MDLEYEYSIIPVIYAFGFKHLTSKFRSGDKHLTHFLMKIVLKHLRLIYIYIHGIVSVHVRTLQYTYINNINSGVLGLLYL